jgi:hypothetical protein
MTRTMLSPMSSISHSAGKSFSLSDRWAPLSVAESETVIIASSADPAHVLIYTAQPAVARRLFRDHPESLAEQHCDDRGRVTGVEFLLPADCLRLRSGKRRLTDRQRAVLVRATAARARRLSVVGTNGETNSTSSLSSAASGGAR